MKLTFPRSQIMCRLYKCLCEACTKKCQIPQCWSWALHGGEKNVEVWICTEEEVLKFDTTWKKKCWSWIVHERRRRSPANELILSKEVLWSCSLGANKKYYVALFFPFFLFFLIESLICVSFVFYWVGHSCRCPTMFLIKLPQIYCIADSVTFYKRSWKL